jgi:hypothetical protein
VRKRRTSVQRKVKLGGMTSAFISETAGSDIIAHPTQPNPTKNFTPPAFNFNSVLCPNMMNIWTELLVNGFTTPYKHNQIIKLIMIESIALAF